MTTAPDLAPALALLDRARGGEDVTDALLAEAARLEALPWSTERYAVQRVIRLAWLAAPDRRGLHAAIRDSVAGQMDARVIAVVLRDDDPLSEPLPANPWRIPPGAGLDAALTHLWSGFAERVPHLVAELRARVIGLALCESTHDGALALAYLHYHELPAYERPDRHGEAPPFDRRAGLAWEAFGDLSSFTGAPPLVGAPTLKPGIEVPPPLRELYAVHAGLGDSMWHLAGPEGLLWWSEMLEHTEPTSVRADSDEDDVLSSQLLCFFGYGDDRSDLFDLRDPTEPLIRAWGDGYLYDGGGELFWEWLDGQRGLMLGFEPIDARGASHPP